VSLEDRLEKESGSGKLERLKSLVSNLHTQFSRKKLRRM